MEVEKENAFNLKICTVLIAMIFTLGGVAQTDKPVVRDNSVLNPVIASPELSGIARFGNIPVDYSSGSIQYSIPLYTIKVDGVQLPLSLSFASQGFKPTDVGNIVGLNWNISGLGSISRQVRGLEDNNGGYLTNEVTQDYIDSIVPMQGSIEGQNLFQYHLNKGTDITQDIYSIQLPGFSSQIFVNASKQLVFSNKSDYKLDVLSGFNFLVTDPYGNKFYFDSTEKTIVVSQNGFSRSTVTSEGKTGWKISKIITNKGKQIAINYSDYSFHYQAASQDMVTVPVYPSHYCVEQGGESPITSSCCGCESSNTLIQGHNTFYFHTKVVSSIVTDEETVEFLYNSEDDSAAYYKLSLKDILIKTNTGKQVDRFHFGYNFFSGVKRFRLDSLFQTGTDTSSNPATSISSLLHKFEYFEDHGLPATNSRSIDENGFFNGASNIYLIYTTNAHYPVAPSDRTVNIEYMQSSMLKKIHFPTGGQVLFSYEANEDDATTNEYYPGLRIGNIRTIALSGEDTTQKIFVYRDPVNIYMMPYQTEVAVITIPNFALGVQYGDCSKKVFTSDYFGDESVMPMPKDFYYAEVDIVDIGSGANLKTTKQFTSFETMKGDLQVRPLAEIYYSYAGGMYDTVRKIVYEYEFKGIEDYPAFVAQYALLPSHPVFLAGISSYFNSEEDIILGCGSDMYEGVAQSLPRFQSVIHTKKTRQYDYSSSGTLVSETEYEYGSNHEMPLVTKTYSSKGDLIEKTTSYTPEALALSSPALSFDESTVISAMVDSNRIYDVVQEDVKVGSTLTNRTRNIFVQEDGKFLLSKSYSHNTVSNSLELEVEVGLFDSKGNVLQVNPKTGITLTYLWDYNFNYPVAKAANASFGEIAYSSFEADSKGNWDYSAASTASYGSVTGEKAYTLSSSNIERTGLNSLKEYVLTYWLKDNGGTLSVNGGSGGSHIVTKNGWKLYHKTIINDSTITLSGTGVVDELRLFPGKAQMTTYTYEPLVGITSECDINNRIIYYEYDMLNRLSIVRDHDRNIVKRYRYTYKETQ